MFTWVCMCDKTVQNEICTHVCTRAHTHTHTHTHTHRGTCKTGEICIRSGECINVSLLIVILYIVFWDVTTGGNEMKNVKESLSTISCNLLWIKHCLKIKSLKEKIFQGTSLAVQWLTLCLPMQGDVDSTPDLGVKIPCGSWSKHQCNNRNDIVTSSIKTKKCPT